MGKQPKPSKQKEQKKQSNTYLKYTSLGLQMVITIGVAGFAGFWLDKQLSFQFPLFLLLFMMGALFGTIYMLVKNLQE